MSLPEGNGPEYSGLQAVGWSSMVETWWDKVLASLLLTTIALGVGYILVSLFLKLRKYLKGRHRVLTVPVAITKYLEDLKSTAQRVSKGGDHSKAPKSFGAFLGSFDNPPTSNQLQLLTKWDIVVLDPQEAGVLKAISTRCTSPHIVARLDLRTLIGFDGSLGNTEVLSSLRKVIWSLDLLKRPEDVESHFTGVLLAEWQSHFAPLIFNEIIKYLDSLGLDVYLELPPPFFLKELERREIDLDIVSGIVCRNGTVLPNGEARNYFQMDGMREAFRAFAQQSVMSNSVVVMWETIDDDARLDHAAVKRSCTWCRFNSAISWYGPQAALRDAEIATTKALAGEPLGALMWLKEEDVIKISDTWRLNDKISKQMSGDHSVYDSLQSFVPNLAKKLSLSPANDQNRIAEQVTQARTSYLLCSETNPFSFSPRGDNYEAMGCFQLGLECSYKDYTDLLEGQRHLRDLNLLEPIKSEELRRIGKELKDVYQSLPFLEVSTAVNKHVVDLIELLTNTNDDKNDRLKMYIGLDSGFHCNLDSQFWGLYDVDSRSGVISVYMSGKTKDRVGTLLHTYMSSRGCSRAQCFQAEVALSKLAGSLSETWQLPTRLVQDIEQLTPTESMLFVQRLALSSIEDCLELASKVRSCCEYQLMIVPSVAQLRALNTVTYLRGDISIQGLLRSRLNWYHDQGCQTPNFPAAVSLFSEVEARVTEILMAGDNQLVSELQAVLETVLVKGKIDASADLFALSVISAFRKLALNEVYLEILDRNPLPNEHPDQAACFAEMFALGSQCHSYFDTTPDALGKVLADKYRLYFKENQPPSKDDASTELPTSYASKLIDMDPKAGALPVGAFYQVTFLGIFALPALIDILLLTTVGRGLYLTAFMTTVEKRMATTALMVSLLLCGAIGTWISSGGSYYLFSMSFPAMNMFVLTRFVAGLTVCVLGGTIAFVVIGASDGLYAATVFLSYLLLLTIYLLALAALSIYQLPGFQFQSGRNSIMMCIPILFISPVLTLWVGHDIVVYVCVLATFLMSLLFCLRRVMSQWATWYLKVPCVTDTEVVNWYTKNILKGDSSALPIGTDLAATPLPRKALQEAVNKERNRRFWTRPTRDETVLRLANGWLSTTFLMDWYCKYSRTKMPYAFSPTWNLQCKAAVQTIRDSQKGLQLHNAFVHWRHASDEVWCGILYFVIALLDKWVVIISGGSMLGLASGDTERFRLSVGFGLAYYLIGALFLDAVAQPLWALANKALPQPITSLEFLHQAAVNDAQAKQKLYWRSFVKFFFVHVWGLCITAALMWAFENNREASIMYIAYVGAYTGLLWYQYNRIFAGPIAFKNLLIAAACGLTVGPIMHHFLPELRFNAVIALAIGTWTAAFLSFRTAKIGVPQFYARKREDTFQETPLFFYSGALSPDFPLSQSTLSDIYDSVSTTEDEFRYMVDPALHPGAEVMNILTSNGDESQLKHLLAAFSSAEQLPCKAAEFWRRGQTVVEIIPTRQQLQQEQKLRSLSKLLGNQLHVFVFVSSDLVDNQWIMNIERNCKVIAEAIVHATGEARLGLSHDHSTLSELLVVKNCGEKRLSIPEGVKRLFECFPAERQKLIANGKETILRHQLLGLHCDLDWDNLPTTIRSLLLKRCSGEPYIISDAQLSWLSSKFCGGDISRVEEYIARYDLGVKLMQEAILFAASLGRSDAYRGQFEPTESPEPLVSLSPRKGDGTSGILHKFQSSIRSVLHSARTCVKFLVISLVADPGYQRELNYLIGERSWIIHWPATFFLNGIWIISKTLQFILIPIFLLHDRESISSLYIAMRGSKTVMEKHRIFIQGLDGPSTCFVTKQGDGSYQLRQYSGNYKSQPDNNSSLMAVNNYSEKLRLQQREEYSKNEVVQSYIYEYQTPTSKTPMERRCIAGAKAGHSWLYDQAGFITAGSAVQDKALIESTYFFRKNAQFDDELLSAAYVFPKVSIKVLWASQPKYNVDELDEWIPNSNVLQAIFIQGSKVYCSTWQYDHKFHPVITTTLNGLKSETPTMISEDVYGVLQKPKTRSFMVDDPLFGFKSARSSLLSRLLRRNIRLDPISTSRARTHLWHTWKKGTDIDAIIARWLDEKALRSEPILKPYWAARDFGRLNAAGKYLNSKTNSIVTRVDLEPQISQWTLLAFKFSDLHSFGQGGDTRINTRDQTTQLGDNDTELHVLAMDTGTWPMESGGVSACRRDMVDNLNTIKWHVLAESANDFGVPRFQIEKNVQSLTILPLWGLDFLTPTHGVFQSCLDSAVQEKSQGTLEMDIKRRFIPILKTLVRCSRALHLDRYHLEEASKALNDLNDYFQESRHWGDVWKSDIVRRTWQEIWLSEDVDNARPISQWLDAECPTLQHLENALDMWHRYLFIFSVPVPKDIPDVVQVSHHFAGASYAVLCKIKRNKTLHVWDHCISWREVTVFLSSAMSFDPPFVCTSLMSLSRLACNLILHHADVVLPCADFFNPGWEIELGTIQGTLEHRKRFNRKIDPVVNGICNMEKFQPIEKIKSKLPTVTMLSHVRFVKDIKNAILAVDIIVNEWHFTDYRLEIWGDMEKAPSYSVECQEIIAAKSLRENVKLMGLGNPTTALEDAWLFLNSSVSEGLPLAMGEAALNGVPVVCTDVGASFRVVTDPVTWKKFSAVVAPNDAYSLAKAQINVLAMLDEWSEYADDGPGETPKLPLHPTPEEAKAITKRMWDKTAQRRRLGMMGRTNVLSSFSSDRYLREHEQMLWIGKYQSPSYRAKGKISAILSIDSSRTSEEKYRMNTSSSGTTQVGSSRSSARNSRWSENFIFDQHRGSLWSDNLTIGAQTGTLWRENFTFGQHRESIWNENFIFNEDTVIVDPENKVNSHEMQAGFRKRSVAFGLSSEY